MANFLQATSTVKQSTVPAATRSAGTLNGAAIDQGASTSEKHDEALFIFETGAVAGTPDSFTVVAKLQDSADNSSWSDVTDLNIIAEEAATVTISAANTIKTFALRNVYGLRRYYRLVLTVAFVNGSSPTVFTNASVLLLKRRTD